MATAAAKTKTAPKRKTTAKAGSGKATGKGQTQSKATDDQKKTPARRSTATRRAGTGTAKTFQQGQELGTGGTKEVPITVVALPDKGYSKRSVTPEEYPFSQLAESKKVDGDIIGPSFFIPESDDPKKLLAKARKRHKDEGFVFWSRTRTEEVNGKPTEGVRVWRALKDAVGIS